MRKVVALLPMKGTSERVPNKNLKNLEDVSLETLSGDLILIDMNTVHASGINRTKHKVKYSAQARYHVVRQHWKSN